MKPDPKVVPDSVVHILPASLRILCVIDALGPCFSEGLILAASVSIVLLVSSCFLPGWLPQTGKCRFSIGGLGYLHLSHGHLMLSP